MNYASNKVGKEEQRVLCTFILDGMAEDDKRH